MSKPRKTGPDRSQPAESRAAEFFTVGWMLSVITTLSCELASLAARWYVHYQPQAVAVGLLSQLLLLAALVSGCVSLILVPVIVKTRRVPPPTGITVFALVVGAAPMAMLLLQKWE